MHHRNSGFQPYSKYIDPWNTKMFQIWPARQKSWPPLHKIIHHVSHLFDPTKDMKKYEKIFGGTRSTSSRHPRVLRNIAFRAGLRNLGARAKKMWAPNNFFSVLFPCFSVPYFCFVIFRWIRAPENKLVAPFWAPSRQGPKLKSCQTLC